MKVNVLQLSILFILLWWLMPASAQQKKRKGEFYASWGYNKEWYTNSHVYVSQPELGNNYKLSSVKGHDHPGWDESDIYNTPISIPQYNYRIGYFFNAEKGLGVEINFDHTKFIIQNDQYIKMTGTYQNRPVDTFIRFRKDSFYYYLNNGANFLLFNFVKRWHWFQNKNSNIKIDGLGKVGIGPVIPHVENALFGQHNDAGFQLGGWNVGIEYAIRSTFYKRVYLEFCGKLDYASYSNLKVYKGTASQNFGCFEMILNLGFTIPAGKKI